MFSVPELHAMPIEYGGRVSWVWVVLLLLLLCVQPMLSYLTVRYPNWNEFKTALGTSLRNITKIVHLHPHPRHA